MAHTTEAGTLAADLFKSFVKEHKNRSAGTMNVNIAMDEVHFLDNGAVVIGPLIVTGLVKVNLIPDSESDCISHTSVMFLVTRRQSLLLAKDIGTKPKQVVVVFDMLHYDDSDRGIIQEAAKAGIDQLDGKTQQED